MFYCQFICDIQLTNGIISLSVRLWQNEPEGAFFFSLRGLMRVFQAKGSSADMRNSTIYFFEMMVRADKSPVLTVRHEKVSLQTSSLITTQVLFILFSQCGREINLTHSLKIYQGYELFSKTCLSSFSGKTASAINTLPFNYLKGISFRWSWNEKSGFNLQGLLCGCWISIF